MSNEKEMDAILQVEYSFWEKLCRPFTAAGVRVAECCRNLGYRCQRFGRGYSDYDQWAMQDWFVRNAKPMLRHLSQKTYHYPDGIGEEQWRRTLAEMAELLEIMDAWDDTAARCKLGLPENDSSAEAMRRIEAEKESAKTRFFALFSHWFYQI